MKTLKANASTEEIKKIINEEKSLGKKDPAFSPAINLALLTDFEKSNYESRKIDGRFCFKNKEEIEAFEDKIYEMLEENGVQYLDFFEGDYLYYYRYLVEEKGIPFNKLWKMMKEVIEEYRYPIATFSMLLFTLEDQKLDF